MGLLPPNASLLERAVETVTERLPAINMPVQDLWNPATCPVEFLPWMAWGLSIDIWNPDWTEAQKRAAITSALPDQAAKGTRGALRKVLDSFDPLIELIEWFEADGSGIPGTFDVALPVHLLAPEKRTAEFARAVLRDIFMVKPVRAHMTIVMMARTEAMVWLSAGGTAALWFRSDSAMDQAAALDPSWAGWLLDENGEPIQDDTPAFLENE